MGKMKDFNKKEIKLIDDLITISLKKGKITSEEEINKILLS